MESSGKPEQVHISEETASFLGEAYYLDEGEEVFGEYDVSIPLVYSVFTSLHIYDLT